MGPKLVLEAIPNDAALLRLAGMVLIEQNDEWLVGRRYLSEASMALVLALDPDAAVDGAAPEQPSALDRKEVPQLTGV